jgi:ribosomal protein S18 acetylase RimI-like enzyme
MTPEGSADFGVEYDRQMDDVTIRQIASDEHDLAGELVVEAYRTLGDVGDEFYESALRDVGARVQTGEVLVVEADGRLVGCVTLSIGLTSLSHVEDPEAATIRMLGVSASARGRGIGEALVRRCIEEAHVRGCKRVRLDTRTSMSSAHRLYARLEFRRDPDHDWSPAPGISLVAYVLDL